MSQEEQVLLFNQQLDRLLADEMPDKVLSDLDEQTLRLAQRLSQVNFSDESLNRHALYTRLRKLSSTGNSKTARHWLPSIIRITSFQVQFVTWVRATLVLLSVLFFGLGIPNPSTIIETSKPQVTNHPVLALVDTPPLIQSYNNQALHPVPIPTPASLSMPNDLPKAQDTRMRLIKNKPAIAHTPKPIPISLLDMER